MKWFWMYFVFLFLCLGIVTCIHTITKPKIPDLVVWKIIRDDMNFIIIDHASDVSSMKKAFCGDHVCTLEVMKLRVLEIGK